MVHLSNQNVATSIESHDLSSLQLVEQHVSFAKHIHSISPAGMP